MSLSPTRRHLAAAAVVVLLSPVAARLAAQQAVQQGSDAAHAAERARLADEKFVTPPPEIMKLVTAPKERNVTLTKEGQSPDGRRFLWLQEGGLGDEAAFGKAHYNLAGLQIDPAANRNRTLTTRGATALVIFDAAAGTHTPVAVPAGATVSGAQWSPDGAQVAFIANFDNASYLYVADAAAGKARRVSERPLLATMVTRPEWAGNEKILTVVVPAKRAAEPKAPAVADGPKVRMTEPGAKNRTRTYADLLEWPYERDLVEYYTTGQLALADARGKGTQAVGAPAMITSVDASPDGKYARVTVMQKPFSYTVQVPSFGTVDQLWDMNGRVLTELSKRPLRGTDDRASSANDTSRRDFAWRPAGGLVYLQQEKAPKRDVSAEEDTTRRAQAKDRLYEWLPPFDSSSRKLLLESSRRMSDVLFTADGKMAVVAENANGTGTVYAVDLAEPAKHHTLARLRGWTAGLGGGRRFSPRGDGADDSTAFYNDPGMLVSQRIGGMPVALRSGDGKYMYFEGTRYFPDARARGPHAFVDRVEIATGKKERAYESEDGTTFEDIVAPIDADYAKAVVTRESATTIPDVYVRDLATKQLRKLTSNVDYWADVTQAQRKMIQVTRADGYKFWVAVTLPKDYRAGTRLPAMFWFYPYEYTDQASYDRSKRTFNPNRFPSFGPRTMDYLVTQGYAVVQPDAPIVGAAGRMNDNYVDDLRNNLSAVIDALDAQGLIDRTRLGIGGHSYGAFSTVNAMVHTPFFKAGIAGDGNYNRTLTPNTFQSERRDLWEARETYLRMSPFLYADHLTGALLMYHALEDQNVGTDPINSTRLFQALLGMGKTAALYMYPYEDHGPLARETLLDLWGRWTAWLDLYVKAGNGGVGASERRSVGASERRSVGASERRSVGAGR